MKNKQLICIACPRGCRINLKVRGKEIVKITGNYCRKGIDYAKEEVTSPCRIITTTVRIENGRYAVVPVRSNKPIPKSKVFQAMKILKRTVLKAPVKIGDIVVKNILNTGVDIVCSRSLNER